MNHRGSDSSEITFRRREGGYREILLIAYPLIIMSASHTIMQFCDRMFLGLYSTDAVAAALPAGVLYFTLFSFFMVNVNFTSALVAQHYGRNDHESCVRAAWNGFYFALGAAVLILAAIPWLGLALIRHGGHDAAIMEQELIYYRTLIPSGALVCMAGAFSSYFTGQGRTWYVTAVNITACLINIVLDYVLIFGKFGMPQWGIAGAGIATTAATGFSMITIFLCFIGQDQRRYPTRRCRRFCPNDIRRLISFGSPAGLQCFLEVGGFTAFSFLIGRISPTAMAVTTIVISINMISFQPLLGLADGTSILVGQYIGAGRYDIAGRLPYRSWLMAGLYMTAAGAVFLLFPGWLIGHFTPDTLAPEKLDAMVKTGAALLACIAVYNFFDATKFVFGAGLRGSGDTRALMLICICGVWLVMVPGVWLMIVVMKTSIAAVWVFMAAYLGLESAVVFYRFRTGRWKSIRMIEPELAAVPLESTEAVRQAPAD
ncbi:MAG: MATE family efflux transporter [Victivallales bacterium]|nr:MATE family efflux transporter [Victivallales bacterium]